MVYTEHSDDTTCGYNRARGIQRGARDTTGHARYNGAREIQRGARNTAGCTEHNRTHEVNRARKYRGSWEHSGSTSARHHGPWSNAVQGVEFTRPLQVHESDGCLRGLVKPRPGLEA